MHWFAKIFLGATLDFAPPLVISEEEVDEIVKRLGAAMDGIRA